MRSALQRRCLAGAGRRQDGGGDGGGGGRCVRAPAAPGPGGMCETYSRWLLRVSVAQICQALGWDSVQVSACDLLTDVLQRYLQGLGRGCHRYCELCECGPGLGRGGCG